MSEQNKETQGNEVTPEKIDELTNEIAGLKQERDNVVGELKEDRKARQELQSQIDTLQQALQDATKANSDTTNQGTDDTVAQVRNVVQEIMQERDASVAKSNKVAAIERFVSEHKEFSPENDTTGKRREALENKLQMFNTEGLQTVEQFYAVVRDAARLLGADTAPSNSSEETVENPYASTPQQSITPKASGEGNLSDKEKRLIQQNGWTEEKYLQLKEKTPDAIEGLLQYVK